jgi:hypothetical protein
MPMWQRVLGPQPPPSSVWLNMIEWLTLSRLGALALEALFQKSSDGRLRYFRDLKRLRREEGRPSHIEPA